jgi:hypothetical protein
MTNAVPMSPEFGRRAFLTGLAGLLATPRAAGAQATAGFFQVEWHCVLTPPQRALVEAWVGRLDTLAQGWWPTITGALASPGNSPASRVFLSIINIRPTTVPAMTVKNRIYVDGPYVLAKIDNPDRLGMVAHELVHVAQAYPGHPTRWLTEGIADYLRYYVLLPRDPGRAFDPLQSDWRAGYQPTAGLLDWAERRRPGVVRAVNADLRQGGDGVGALVKAAGAPPDDLWRAYLATGPAAAAPAALRARQRALQTS